jgi:hypothetical protein
VSDGVVNAVGFCKEGLPAEVASESLLLGMDSLVHSQISRLSESLLAGFALVSLYLLVLRFNVHGQSVLACVGAHAARLQAEVSFPFSLACRCQCGSNKSLKQ